MHALTTKNMAVSPLDMSQKINQIILWTRIRQTAHAHLLAACYCLANTYSWTIYNIFDKCLLGHRWTRAFQLYKDLDSVSDRKPSKPASTFCVLNKNEQRTILNRTQKFKKANALCQDSRCNSWIQTRDIQEVHEDHGGCEEFHCHWWISKSDTWDVKSSSVWIR